MDNNIRCIHRLHPISFNESVNKFTENRLPQSLRKYDLNTSYRSIHDIAIECSPALVKRSNSSHNSLISISCPVLKDKAINEIFKTPSLFYKIRPMRRSSSSHDLQRKFSSNSRVYSSHMIQPFRWISNHYKYPRKYRNIKTKRKNITEDETYNKRDIQVFYSSDTNRQKRNQKSRKRIQDQCELDLCEKATKSHAKLFDSNSFDYPAPGCQVRKCFDKGPPLATNSLQSRPTDRTDGNNSTPANCECSLTQHYNTVNFPDSSSKSKINNNKPNISSNNICQCSKPNIASNNICQCFKPNSSSNNICQCFEPQTSQNPQSVTKVIPAILEAPKEGSDPRVTQTSNKEISPKHAGKLTKTKWAKERTRKVKQLLSKIRSYKIPKYPVCLIKNAFKCFLFSVIIIVWSPCIIVMYLCWVLTYPLRPKHVTSGVRTDVKGKKLDFWNTITNVVTKKLGAIYNMLTHYTRADQCSKSLDTKRRFSQKSLLREPRSQKRIPQKLMPQNSVPVKQKDDKMFHNKLCLNSNPDPKMRYTLYHSPSRGWLLKPLSSRVTESELHLQYEENNKNGATNNKNIKFADDTKVTNNGAENRASNKLDDNHRCECLQSSENNKVENENKETIKNEREYSIQGPVYRSSPKSSKNNAILLSKKKNMTPEITSRKRFENDNTLRAKDDKGLIEGLDVPTSHKSSENKRTFSKQKYLTPGTSSRKGLENNKTLLSKKEYVIPGPSKDQSNKKIPVKEEYLIPGPSSRKGLENNKTLLSKEEYSIPGPSNRKSLDKNEILLRKEEYLIPGPPSRKGMENNETLLTKEEYYFPGYPNRTGLENSKILLNKEEYLIPGVPSRKSIEINKTSPVQKTHSIPGTHNRRNALPTVIEIDPKPNKIYKSSSVVERGQKWVPVKNHIFSSKFLKSLQNHKHKKKQLLVSPDQMRCLCINSKSSMETHTPYSEPELKKKKKYRTVLVNLKNVKLHKDETKYENPIINKNVLINKKQKRIDYRNKSRIVPINESKKKHRNECRECIYEYEDECGNKCTTKFRQNLKRGIKKTREKKSKCSYKYKKKHQKSFRKTCRRKCKKKGKMKSICKTCKQVLAILQSSKQTIWGWFNDGGSDEWRGGCRDIYINTLRSRPCFFIYRCWPSFYPYFLTLCNFNKNLLNGFCLVLSACVWCPIFFCCYICLLMCSCCDC